MTMFLTICIFTTMFSTTVIGVKADKTELQTLFRQKRSWIIPPKKLYENVDYTKDEFIVKISSDEENRTNIIYHLLGPAADDGLFTVGRKDGLVKIHGILDREKQASYSLKGRAQLPNGTLVEKDLDLEIIVLDQNDNAPEFMYSMTGSVEELSDTDTMIFRVTATDKDQEGTPHSKISYSVMEQDPAGEMMMFKIERGSDEIKVSMNTLDREKQDTYKLIITARDMDGKDSDPNNKPMTGTGTVTINILDVNDNIPTLEEGSYEGSVEENIKNQEAIRIKTIDKDKEYTENWEAVYTIISGNEAGHFTISTDPKTNEGILMITKELNYEEVKEISLKVVVNNKAPYHKSVVNNKITEYPIKIKVKNVREAPHFHPAVKVVRVSEDPKVTDLSKVITTYTAIDTDTNLTATNIRYLKGEDAAHLVSIDKHTGEVRLIKYPDYESEYVKNGSYYVKILAITKDSPPKTVTGTLAIYVEDINDHAPILTSSVGTLCYGDSELYVSATDKDSYPNAEKFKFMVIEGTKEKWSIKPFNATTSILSSQEILWPGHYTVELQVKDQQGKSSEVQKLQVSVCMCTNYARSGDPVCQQKRQSGTGPVLGKEGVLVVLLGILLLLAIPVLLLVCDCGGIKKEFPFEPEQNLISYHTECQGEDMVDTKLMCLIPVNESRDNGNLVAGWGKQEYWRNYEWKSQKEYIHGQWSVEATEDSEYFTANTFNFMALSRDVLRQHFDKKSRLIDEASPDYLLVPSYEDSISDTNSLNDPICNLIYNKDELDFLDDLGPEFKNLATICCGSAIKPK